MTKAQYKPPASLLCWHLEALRASPADASTILETARAHVAQYPSSPVLQLARLELERTQSNDVEDVRKAFKSAMKSIAVPDLSSEEQLAGSGIWASYLDWEEEQSGDDYTRLEGIYRKVLRDTLRQTTIPNLHDSILVKYLDLQIRHQPTSILSVLERISSTYRPNHSFFSDAFDTISERSTSPHEDLRVVYRLWRASSQSRNNDKVDAALHWAEWLLDHRHGKEASDVVDVMRREVGQDRSGSGLSALERGWALMLDNAEKQPDEGSDEDGDVEMGQEEEGSEESE